MLSTIQSRFHVFIHLNSRESYRKGLVLSSFYNTDLIIVIWIGVFSGLRHGCLSTWLLEVSWVCVGGAVVLLMETCIQDAPEMGRRGRPGPLREPVLSVCLLWRGESSLPLQSPSQGAGCREQR